MFLTWDGQLIFSEILKACQQTTHQLHVPPFRLSTVGRRSFLVAAAILWNTLPVDVQSFPSLAVFRQRLKPFLFHKSFPDVVWQADYAFVDLVMAYCYFSHVKNFLINCLIDRNVILAAVFVKFETCDGMDLCQRAIPTSCRATLLCGNTR